MAKAIDVNLAAFHQEPAAKAAARIVVSKDNLLQLTGALENDRLCIIESLSITDAAPVLREASLWASPEPLKKGLARISKAFREAAGLSASDKCRITVDGRSLPDAVEVEVEDITNRDGLAPLPVVKGPHMWAGILEDQLDLAEVVFPGMVVKDVYHRRTKRTFRIKTVNERTDSIARFVVDHTRVQFTNNAASAASSQIPAPPQTPQTPKTPKTPKPSFTATLPVRTAVQPPRIIKLEPIEGLDPAVEEINKFLSLFNPDLGFTFPGRSCAVVLQGDKGTGKTFLLDRIAATGWGTVFPILPTDKLTKIQETFKEAYDQRPSIVTIDNLQDLLAEERNNRTAVIQSLCSMLDSNVSKADVPQLIVLATCFDYLKDIPLNLRDRGRFNKVIDLPFPDPAGRRAILRSFKMPLPVDRAEDMIKALSHQTHAFNGHDLWNLFEEAFLCRAQKLTISQRQQRKQIQGTHDGEAEINASHNTTEPVYLTEEDFEDARKCVRPSRMEGVNIKPRPVYWSEIHGQDDLIEALQSRVDVLNFPEKYVSRVKPFTRGFLLYGPPGCSKTMAAQAMATESELNYFSVKGGELLNQYVGETERGIRDLFARARRASPAVIFLDEIDALAGRRSDFGDSSASSGRGPQMVPALLSELDGFEPLDKVLVVAATNRPEVLDPALLRTGRIDKHFYVPPPNEGARRAIFEGWAKGMCVSPDLDLDALARESTQLSGAEIIGVCQKTSENTFRAYRAQKGPELITTEAFLEVIRRTPRTITSEMVANYASWTPTYKPSARVDLPKASNPGFPSGNASF